MGNDLAELEGATVIGVTDTQIYFSNGAILTIHPYETYLDFTKGEANA